jgi:superfamily I DNA/RNA helicase
MLAGHRRALVDGCAGSGKTFLAIEKARRLASEGFDTLLTCFNRNLASWIRDSLDPHPDRLRVQHFHELAHQLVNQAGLQTIGSDADLDRYFKETLPTLLLDAIDRIDTRFEAIVVDEGQDFEAEWWVPLMGLLRAPDDIMYVFYDSRQSIYTDAMSLPFDSDPHFLPVNLRNTQAIHRLIAPHYTGQVTTCRGPEGRAPRHLRAGDPEAALRAELHRLVHDEGIPTSDIVVLTAAGRERSRWREGQRIGNQRLTWEDAPGHDEVRVATIHSFKGLERPVVIVTESDRARGPHRDQLQLVARSRAMSELVIIDSA